MKLAFTLLLVGIAQSQTLLNTLRNLGADDSSIKNGISTSTYLSTNINENLLLKAIDAKFADDINDIYAKAAKKKEAIDYKISAIKKYLDAQKKALDAKFADDINDIYAKAAKKKEAIDYQISAIKKYLDAQKKALDAKVVEDIKDKYAQAVAKKKEIYERDPLQKLLMQEPKGGPGFTPDKVAVNTFKKLGALKYKKLVDDGIVEEPTQRVTIKHNFQRQIVRSKMLKLWSSPLYFEFAQVNSDDQLHGFTRYITPFGSVIEGEFRNGQKHGFERNISCNNKINAYAIHWFKNNQRKGNFNYSIGQYNHINERYFQDWMNAKNKEAHAKFIKNGQKSYFMKY